MANMKTKVRALLMPDIKLCKVTGPCNGKSAGYKVGDFVNVSIKQGKFANPISRPGNKCKGLKMFDRNRTNSDTYAGITDIQHNNNVISIIDTTKKTVLGSSFGNLAIHQKCENVFRALDRSAKRKESKHAMRYL